MFGGRSDVITTSGRVFGGRPDVIMIADCLINFFLQLRPPANLPAGTAALYPHRQREVQETIRSFFGQYFADTQKRHLMVGINPGRFGAGITGINFTAPRQLTEDCRIDHPFGNSSELSAEFIYKVINAYGGATSFYQQFFIASVSPIGYTRNGKNLNYYDDPELAESIRPYSARCLKKLLQCGFHQKVVVCIGGDKNFKFLESLNRQHGFFEEILSVPHPRFIMQYRRSKLNEYVQEYLRALEYCVNK